MDEKELERLAQEELLTEAKRGKIRAETMGMLGWKKSPVPRTNKRFLTNMLMSTIEPKRRKTEPKDSHHDSEVHVHNVSHKKSKKSNKQDKKSSRKSKYDDKRNPTKSKHKKKHKSKRKD